MNHEICEVCQQSTANVHVTDVAMQPAEDGAGDEAVVAEERHLCDACAKSLQLPFGGPDPKGAINVWKLLKQSAKLAHEKSSLRCPECGMTLAEFRSKGRLGCEKDYEVFREHLDPLLRRVHNATEHTGRVPGQDEDTARRRRHLTDLRARLEAAIREEAYEAAADLRNEIRELETSSDTD